ncbi:MAG: dTMP kinase [Gammaproteobacteria bacterium]
MIRRWAGRFITVEGIEGVGKSTHIGFMADYLRAAGKTVVVTREPGGTALGELLRGILLDPSVEAMSPETETLLMFAARAEHVVRVIRPALAAGKWVLSDRFTDATYAYQGGGRKVARKYIHNFECFVHSDLKPHVTFLLDAPPDIALARIRERCANDRVEGERIEFFSLVRDRYLDIAREQPDRIRVIDASEPIADVQVQLVRVLQETLSVAGSLPATQS